jgi:O-antigen/teichoic acid export membrane protein
MTAEQYGYYALVIASAGILNAVCFQWLSVSLGRFFPAQENPPEQLLSTTLIGFLVLISLTGGLAAAVASLWLWSETTLLWLTALTVLIGWAQAWFDLNLKLVNTQLAPVRYGLIYSSKALLGIGAGAALFYLGLGVIGVLLGLAFSLLASSFLAWKNWKGISLRHSDIGLLRELIEYGAPLTVTFMLTLVVGISDRYLLGWFMDAKAVGSYAAAYDLPQQSLVMLMGIVHLAAFPLVVNAIENNRSVEAQAQLRETALLLLGISLPATVGLIILADNIAMVALGSEFREAGEQIIPCVALATFVGALKAFYLDYSFQLGRQMRMHAWVMAITAIVNILLNLLLIPIYGLRGAAYATLGAFVVGFVSSWRLGRKVFPLPYPKDSYKVIIASIGMAVILWLTSAWHGPKELAIQILLGGAAYGFLILLLHSKRSVQLVRSYASTFYSQHLPRIHPSCSTKN